MTLCDAKEQVTWNVFSYLKIKYILILSLSRSFIFKYIVTLQPEMQIYARIIHTNISMDVGTKTKPCALFTFSSLRQLQLGLNDQKLNKK